MLRSAVRALLPPDKVHRGSWGNCVKGRTGGAALAVVAMTLTLVPQPAFGIDSTNKRAATCEVTNPRSSASSAIDPAAREDTWFAGYSVPSVRKDWYRRLAATDTNKDGVVCEWPHVLSTGNFPLGVPDNARLFAISLLENLRERAGKDELCSAYADQGTRSAVISSLSANRESLGLDEGTAARIVDGSLAEICSSRRGMLTIKTARVDAATIGFTSCTVLNEIHPAGIASSKTAANEIAAQGYLMPRVSKPIYRANTRLDRDNEGVICPLKPALAFVATAPAPSPAVPSAPSAAPAPQGSSPSRTPDNSAGGCVSPSEFASAREGMSVAQVSELFGVSGTVTAESSAFGTTVVLRDYPACTEFGAVSVVFTDGRLTSKAAVF